ncbi:HK97 gp10 family phage protein [Curtobacterium sp. VKM Ac-2861]|uniref:HK97 gp10 family phage protein n=1 Tax=Curtobacterium sp. VKM Ac-2861 TaxID=2739016 RepID=UPI0015633C67|nr:HK97 gp10 family phage protein [Curtobacterium sp. VKM Ac-2861]
MAGGEGSAVRVRVDGLNKAVRALRKSGADMQDMSELMHAIGTTVVLAARPRAPHLSGAVSRSIRAGRGKTKAVIRAGSARVPYAGVQHYGWPAHGIAAHPFLTDALRQEAADIYDQLDRGLMAILAKNGLPD